MTDTNPAKFNKLVTLLKELFQLDQPDLDFGIYRIMHAKAGEVTQFLERDLLPQVKDAFASYQPADKAALQAELAKAIEQAQALGADPETLPKVKELRQRIATESVDIGALENETYDHLFSFFRRYYSEGDFLAKRVYKPGVYAIPYEGEEVTLHWANKDQYYIKTSEYLRDYAFRLRPEAGEGEDAMRVHFKLVDAAEGEHGNVKAAEGRDRVFVLAAEDFIGVENGELEIRFKYRPATMEDWPTDQRDGKKKPPAQKDLATFAVGRVLASGAEYAKWLAELKKSHIKTDGEQADYTRLEAHLRRYSARNTFDYFIHKDLGGFLRRELDFYIKNEVMHLDDVESETAAKVEQYLSKIKVIRRIAGKIIDFLEQLENFQKKLWLKKKFVVSVSYCITLDRVSHSMYQKIAGNKNQWARWRELGLWDREEDGTAHDLMENQHLAIDTSVYSDEFNDELLAQIEDLESAISGYLFGSENFQAGRIIRDKYKSKANLVYLDPPYNTDATPILYKNGYKESSWASLMSDRIEIANELVSSDGAVAYAIDDTEVAVLKELIQKSNPASDVFQCIVEHYPGSGTGRSNVSRTHEYCLFSIAHDADVLRGDAVDDGERVRGFRRAGTGDNNFRIGNPGRPESFYAVLVDKETFEVKGVEPPPQIGSPYPVDDTEQGYKRVYPIGEDGSERVWTLSYEGVQDALARKAIISSEGFVIKRIYQDKDRRLLLPSIWQGAQYNATTGGTNLLTAMFGTAGRFSYPKSIGTMERVLDATIYGLDKSLTIDLFGGSGTTAHAAINRMRTRGGVHKYLVVEMGEHADSVIKDRILKAVYTDQWNDGKPVSRLGGISHLLKCINLESYEDSINNLDLSRSAEQQSAFDFPAAQAIDGLREQYLLRYQLDVESRGSASLLDIKAFSDPTAYKLKVKSPGSDESREVNVDLLETFNWLLGLTVQHIAAPRRFAAEFERDSEQRLKLKGRLKQDAAGPWWFRTVTGTTPEGRKTLLIWRKLTGDAEQDNLVLETWFRDKQAFSVKDTEFDLIYVNGDNTLENLRLPDESWKVRLTEEDFQRLMFEGTEA